MSGRASFHQLGAEDQRLFGNGVGPRWMAPRLRLFITVFASWFFNEASWRHHDFGYFVGGDRWDRARCDAKFFLAMLKDSVRQAGLSAILKIPAALFVSLLFYAAVRLFGQFGSFRYRDAPLHQEEITNLAI